MRDEIISKTCLSFIIFIFSVQGLKQSKIREQGRTRKAFGSSQFEDLTNRGRMESQKKGEKRGRRKVKKEVEER